jgi:adenylylsulfate kinase-like enzyme
MTIKTLEPFTIWLIGPSASGKSTIAKELYDKIQNKVSKVIILDGDNIRDLFDNRYGYDATSRSKVTKRYIKLVKWLESFQISSIVSVISPFEKDRLECKESLIGYKQIYLKCSMENRMLRDKKNLYKPALEGLKKDVIDVDIPFDQSSINDLVIETDKYSIEVSTNKIIESI